MVCSSKIANYITTYDNLEQNAHWAQVFEGSGDCSGRDNNIKGIKERVNCEGKLLVSNCPDSLKKTSNELKTLNFGSRPREETTGTLWLMK